MSNAVYCYKWNRFVDDSYQHTQCVCDITPELDQLAYTLLREASPPPAWPPAVRFATEGTAPEDVPAFVRWPLVSDRVRDLVESHSLTGAVFYPVQMDSSLPVPIPRYWYVHLQHVSDAIDYDRSTWRQMNIKLPSGGTAHPISVIKYVLKRKAIEGWDLFRCVDQEGGRSGVFCSERFRDLFIGHACTGLGFDPVPVSD